MNTHTQIPNFFRIVSIDTKSKFNSGARKKSGADFTRIIQRNCSNGYRPF